MAKGRRKTFQNVITCLTCSYLFILVHDISFVHSLLLGEFCAALTSMPFSGNSEVFVPVTWLNACLLKSEGPVDKGSSYCCVEMSEAFFAGHSASFGPICSQH